MLPCTFIPLLKLCNYSLHMFVESAGDIAKIFKLSLFVYM